MEAGAARREREPLPEHEDGEEVHAVGRAVHEDVARAALGRLGEGERLGVARARFVYE